MVYLLRRKRWITWEVNSHSGGSEEDLSDDGKARLARVVLSGLRRSGILHYQTCRVLTTKPQSSHDVAACCMSLYSGQPARSVFARTDKVAYVISTCVIKAAPMLIGVCIHVNVLKNLKCQHTALNPELSEMLLESRLHC